MSGTPPPTSAAKFCAIRVGQQIDRDTFERVRRQMMLQFCKWDTQVGDVTALADFPLILDRTQWDYLRSCAQSLARETLEMEARLMDRPDLFQTLGLGGALQTLMHQAQRHRMAPSACRVMRFDFHPTPQGWRISEINSDVPGGFAEASAFPQLMSECLDTASPAGDPQAMIADSICRAAAERRGIVAMLSAPGFMEDQQVVCGLAKRLRDRGVASMLVQVNQLQWQDGQAAAHTSAGPIQVCAIVRFYQGEWMARLPRRFGWHHLFAGGRVPVMNPGCAILTESKRLPLVWGELGVNAPTWKCLLPETRDPRDAPWTVDDGWLLKAAYCNTGDSVTIRELLPRTEWLMRKIDVRFHPTQWIAQRRFQTNALATPRGYMFPCIGVYTIDGLACGIYGRLAPGPVIDYAAIDVAVLIERAQ